VAHPASLDSPPSTNYGTSDAPLVTDSGGQFG
jgi:hypothetical protein